MSHFVSIVEVHGIIDLYSLVDFVHDSPFGETQGVSHAFTDLVEFRVIHPGETIDDDSSLFPWHLSIE